MTGNPGTCRLWFLVFVTGAAVFLISHVLNDFVKSFLSPESESLWIVRFLFTLLGYAAVFLPGYVLVKNARESRLLEDGGLLGRIARLILTGSFSTATSSADVEKLLEETKTSTKETNFFKDALILVTCCCGLQISYLTWGVLQEKIMTQDYAGIDGKAEKFKDSQFLVFVNRILAFILSGLYLLVKRRQQARHKTPLYEYSLCSVSNTLSSWCQYEALKFVSFPTQVLAKSAKVIPVMLMGKLVSGTKYKKYEYTTALLISVGMAAFFFGSSEDRKNTTTTLSGLVLLCGYLVFDSFTANWQSALFKEHKPSSVQMMCGVNLISCLLTSASLLQHGGFVYSFGFAVKYPRFIFDCLLTAVTSATGQLFIFATISHFGAVVFTIVMTVRQGLSILLSCIIYGHPISAVGILGILFVFFAIFLRIYCSHREKVLTRMRSSENTAKV
nr:EOG090X05CU [Eulimnadia texana]